MRHTCNQSRNVLTTLKSLLLVSAVGRRSLLQGIFPTQVPNPGLSRCRQILYRLSHEGSPRNWNWYPIPSPADLPDPGIEPGSPELQADSLPTELSGKPFIKNRRKQIEVFQAKKSYLTLMAPGIALRCIEMPLGH